MPYEAGTPIEKFMRRVFIEADGCWRWVGSINPRSGYGLFGHRAYAHRWSYEHHVGVIPEGLDIDHLCRNRYCVNPDHLEAVTRRTNLVRGATLIAANVNKTHCPQGHPYEGANLIMDGTGRKCRVCCNERALVRYYRGR
jgi:hypothetical protein